MKKLNMNSTIKVKLTPFGADIFYHQFDELNKKVLNSGGRPIHPRMPEIDNKGFSKFQLHHFINLYGDYMTVGQKKTLLRIYLYTLMRKIWSEAIYRNRGCGHAGT